MRKFRTAAALALCAVCLLQTAAPVLAAEDYPAPDVSGKTVEELIDAFRADHDLTEDNFELSYYNTVTGESYDFNETKMLYGASTYKLPLNLYYYEMENAGEIASDALMTQGGATLHLCHYLSIVESNNEISHALLYRIGNFRDYKNAMRTYFTMTDEEIDPKYYQDNYYCTRMMMDCLTYLYAHADDFSEMEIVSRGEGRIPDTFPYFSLLNISGTAKGVTIRDAKYPLNKAEITCDYAYGVSNEPLPGKTAAVTVDEGRLLLIRDRK